MAEMCEYPLWMTSVFFGILFQSLCAKTMIAIGNFHFPQSFTKYIETYG